MENIQNFIDLLFVQFSQNEDFVNIKSGRRYHSQKSENKRLKRGTRQLRNLEKGSIKLERKPLRSLRFQ